MNIIETIKFWINNARPYSVPMTFLSWLVVFCFSIKHGGNILCGLVALIGISLVHLATNLCDDYFDYQRLCCDETYLNSSKEIKCRYLRNGQATIKDLQKVIIFMLLIAGICGVVLFYLSGWYVLLFALAVLPIALFYSKLSSKGFGDVAVILAYGPLMFEGVFYVMTKHLSFDVLILSIACSMFVNAVLYAHMLMDFDEDICSSKRTLCTILKTKKRALKFLSIFYIIGYVSIIVLSVKSNNLYYLISLITIPLVFDLFSLLKLYNEDKYAIPYAQPWHYPLENWEKVKQTQNASFFLRFMFARNISTWFMLSVCFSLMIS
ncbi:prenyltransferase [bacterium]|nr:prenyltransferase [bacterium]